MSILYLKESLLPFLGHICLSKSYSVGLPSISCRLSLLVPAVTGPDQGTTAFSGNTGRGFARHKIVILLPNRTRQKKALSNERDTKS